METDCRIDEVFTVLREVLRDQMWVTKDAAQALALKGAEWPHGEPNHLARFASDARRHFRGNPDEGYLLIVDRTELERDFSAFPGRL